MYRLRSHIDESLNRTFNCYEDMLAYVTANDVSSSDATLEEWIDNRIDPSLSMWVEVS